VALLIVAALVILRFVVFPRPAYSNSRGARVVHYKLASPILGRSVHELAVIPKGDGRRPLLVFLHGRHDTRPWSWLVPSQPGPDSVLSDELFAALQHLGRRAPIVVILNGLGHSYYHDRRAARYGSAILREAIPDAIHRFQTSDRVAIGGISMGGYGALHLASLEPKRFCAVGGHSAALWKQGGDSAPGAFDDAADFERNDLFAPAARRRLGRLPVWLDVGAEDPFRVADTDFARLLRRDHTAATFHVWAGSHSRSYWNAHIDEYLQFYARHLADCDR
jgi:S-formylglutathione hydrolase FrmB